MGICYKLWLRDDLDWNYPNVNKRDVGDQVRRVCPEAELDADFMNWLVYDVGETDPARFFENVCCDDMLFTDNVSVFLPMKVDND